MRYTRRRRAAACFNGEQYERSEFRKTCPCTEEDYECDYGYERATESGPCVAVMAISSAPPADCRGTYNVSNGYRLVAGDTCDPSKEQRFVFKNGDVVIRLRRDSWDCGM